MTWNGTKTWAVGDGPWSASIMNQYIRDNIQYVRDTQRIGVYSQFLTSGVNAAPVSYNDITSLRMTFFKKNATTHLICRYSVQCWASVAATAIKFGLNLSGGGITPVDLDSTPFLFNQANVVKHVYVARFWLAQQPVGRYSLQARYKILSGAGNFNTNTSCYAEMEVCEDAVE
jgi:hypothetical protein